jgi:hypothetical protein
MSDQKNSANLSIARVISGDAGERSENSDLYRWAQLVMKRHEAGQSIAEADKWLCEIMAGTDMEYLEREPWSR